MFKGIKISRKLISALTIFAVLATSSNVFAAEYSVKAGDSLWKISNAFGKSISDIKTQNNLSSDMLLIGQNINIAGYIIITVLPTDSLWLLSKKYGCSIDDIKKANDLTSDMILDGQKLYIKSNIAQPTSTPIIIATKVPTPTVSPKPTNTPSPVPTVTPTLMPTTTPTVLPTNTPITMPTPTVSPIPRVTSTPVPRPQPVLNWPDKTYIVKAGDTVDSISKLFGSSGSNIFKYNYMTVYDWFNEGEKIAISGYAPRQYAVIPGEAVAPLRKGTLVDWFLDGQYLIKRGDVFLITDVDTGAQFKVRMYGGYNHSDVETVTADDTAIMYKMFNSTWQWKPGAVVIYKDGMNIAASLSGMPHSFDSIAGNNMTGHCDLYLENSIPHGEQVDPVYVQEHYQMVMKAAGM